MSVLMPAEMLEGQIQRGLGSGFLEAIARPRSEIEPMVLGCLAHDPRLNAQDEERDLYYARLVLALDIDEAPIGRVLRAGHGGDPSATVHWLPLGVLGLLARAGRVGAVAILRDYVAWGEDVGTALQVLGATDDPGALEGLDAVLASRLGPDATTAALDRVAWLRYEEPWETWRTHGPLAPLLRAAEDPRPPEPEPKPDLASLGAGELLRRVRGFPRPDPADELLVSRIRGGDIEARALVEAALANSDPARAVRAVRVLGQLGDPSIVPVGERLAAEFEPGKGSLLPYLTRGFEGLESAVALEVARRWRNVDDYRETIATRLLELHATEEDLVWIVTRIRQAAARGEDLYPYAGILRRFPNTGPFEGFEDIYRSYVPTCCRARLLDGMSVADPTFGATLAYECLFDCESLARAAAARTVHADAPALDRLRSLAADSLEDDDVRTAASERIAPRR